jgi:tetratricopeptide (TPR) repeat protein
MSDAQRYDDSELNVDHAPPLTDLVDLARQNLLTLLAYVENNPSLADLQARADEIMTMIQAASGLEGTEELAAELALAVDSKFGRLGLWRAWYPHLLSLYAPLSENASGLSRARLFQCLMNYYLHHGDLPRANLVINTLLDIAESDPTVPLQEAMLGAASVASSLANNDDGLILAEQLLDLAQLTGDKRLMGKTLSVLCQFYLYRFEPYHTFEYGQMTYCVGLGLHDDHFLISGLHYMALGLQLGGQPLRAFPYLKRAMARSCASGESSHMLYLRYTWGYGCYLSGRYAQAAHLLSRCVHTFTGRGHYFASALYMCGISQMQLQRFAEAEAMLKRAAAEWLSAKQAFDQFFAGHALAHLYWLDGRYDEAVRQGEEILAAVEATNNPRRDTLLNELQKDLDKYRAARDRVQVQRSC